MYGSCWSDTLNLPLFKFTVKFCTCKLILIFIRFFDHFPSFSMSIYPAYVCICPDFFPIHRLWKFRLDGTTVYACCFIGVVNGREYYVLHIIVFGGKFSRKCFYRETTFRQEIQLLATLTPTNQQASSTNQNRLVNLIVVYVYISTNQISLLEKFHERNFPMKGRLQLHFNQLEVNQ